MVTSAREGWGDGWRRWRARTPNDMTSPRRGARVPVLQKRADRTAKDALELCGIVSREGRPTPHVEGTGTVDYRDLCAVVRTVPFERLEPTDARIASYRAAVEGAFACGAVI